MKLRRAGPVDLEGLLVLAANFYKLDDHEYNERRLAAALGPLLDSDEHGLVWVAEDDAGLRGYAVLTWGYSLESGGRDAILDELYVDDRNRRVGSELLATVSHDAAGRSVRRIYLETQPRNAAARRFYRRSGFEELDSIWMIKDLPD